MNEASEVLRIMKPMDILTRANLRKRKVMVVAAAEDEEVLEAVSNAKSRGIIEPVLVGSLERIVEVAGRIGFALDNIRLIPAETPELAVEKSLLEASEGRADILMKGFVNTAVFLKGVLDKRYGLRRNALLSHVALFFPETVAKPVFVTDAALNLYPSFEDKVTILRNCIEVAHSLGLSNPKVALIAHNEIPSEKVPWSQEALKIRMMNEQGALAECVVDGPMALDLAISQEAAHHKKYLSPVAGDADILFCPDIVSANILYKAMLFLGKAKGAAIMVGARIPLVVTSRAEDAEGKLLSIALAASS